MSKETTALVVGKFAPLHVGHQFLIETAIQTADHVVVLCWSNTGENYGDSLAARLSAEHIRIPRSISGTNIRADVSASLEHLHPLVRDYVVERVNHDGVLK